MTGWLIVVLYNVSQDFAIWRMILLDLIEIQCFKSVRRLFMLDLGDYGTLTKLH